MKPSQFPNYVVSGDWFKSTTYGAQLANVWLFGHSSPTNGSWWFPRSISGDDRGYIFAVAVGDMESNLSRSYEGYRHNRW